MASKIANNFREMFIQFSNLNGCSPGECDEDSCKDYNKLAQKKYTPANLLGQGGEKGELTKSNLLTKLSRGPTNIALNLVCSSADKKFGFLCFNSPENRVAPNSNSNPNPNDLSLEEYAEIEKVMVDVFWDEMKAAAGDEYKSDTSSITYEGYKKWKDSAVYSNIPLWKDSETDLLGCEFKGKDYQFQYNQIKYKLKNGAGGTSPNFGKCVGPLKELKQLEGKVLTSKGNTIHQWGSTTCMSDDASRQCQDDLGKKQSWCRGPNNYPKANDYDLVDCVGQLTPYALTLNLNPGSDLVFIDDDKFSIKNYRVQDWSLSNYKNTRTYTDNDRCLSYEYQIADQPNGIPLIEDKTIVNRMTVDKAVDDSVSLLITTSGKQYEYIWTNSISGHHISYDGYWDRNEVIGSMNPNNLGKTWPWSGLGALLAPGEDPENPDFVKEQLMQNESATELWSVKNAKGWKVKEVARQDPTRWQEGYDFFKYFNDEMVLRAVKVMTGEDLKRYIETSGGIEFSSDDDAGRAADITYWTQGKGFNKLKKTYGAKEGVGDLYMSKTRFMEIVGDLKPGMKTAETTALDEKFDSTLTKLKTTSFIYGKENRWEDFRYSSKENTYVKDKLPLSEVISILNKEYDPNF